MGIRNAASVALLIALLLPPAMAFAAQAPAAMQAPVVIDNSGPFPIKNIPSKGLTVPPPAPGQQLTPVIGVFSGAAAGKFDNMTPEQRDAYVKQMAAKIKAMSPAERKAFFEGNRKSYAAMTPAQKKEMADRIKAASAQYVAAHKAEWDKANANVGKLSAKDKEFLDKMPGIERAVLQKYKDMRKTHNKDFAWHEIIQEAGKGGKITPIPE